MEVNNKKAVEVNSELKINADGQHLDMNYLKEKYEIDDDDEVEQITAAGTPMENTPVCVTCNKTSAIKSWLNKPIQKEHTELG